MPATRLWLTSVVQKAARSWALPFRLSGRRSRTFHDAISLAQRQTARFIELRVALDLARLWPDQPVPMSGSDVFKTVLGVSPLMQPLRGIGDIVNYFRGTNYPRQPTMPATIVLPAGGNVSGLPHAASAFSSANAGKHHTAARSALSTGGDSSRGCAANAFGLDVHALSAGGNRNATGSARQLFSTRAQRPLAQTQSVSPF